MKKVLASILFLLFALSGAHAQQESGAPAQAAPAPSMARVGIGVMYQMSDNMGIFRNDEERQDRRNVTHVRTDQIGLMLDYYVNRFFFISGNISFGYRREYRYGGGDRRIGIAQAIATDIGFLINGRIPVGNLFAFTGGLGWYFNTPITFLSGEHERYLGEHNFRFNTGMLLRIGMEIGSMRSGSVYAPLGFEARFDIMNGFLYGFYAGVGFRL